MQLLAQKSKPPARIIVMNEHGDRLDDPFDPGVTWLAILEFCEIHQCSVFRNGDAVHVYGVAIPPSQWGRA